MISRWVGVERLDQVDEAILPLNRIVRLGSGPSIMVAFYEFGSGPSGGCGAVGGGAAAVAQLEHGGRTPLRLAWVCGLQLMRWLVIRFGP
jgi:hypothetical protein